MYNEVDNFVFVHLLCMEVCDKKTDIVALKLSKRKYKFYNANQIDKCP